MKKILITCLLLVTLDTMTADQQPPHAPGLVYSQINQNVLVGSPEWLGGYDQLFMNITQVAQQYQDEVVSEEAASMFVQAIIGGLRTDIEHLIDAYQDYDEDPDIEYMLAEDALTIYDQYEMLREITGQDLLDLLNAFNQHVQNLGGQLLVDTTDLLNNFMQDAYLMGAGEDNQAEALDDDNQEAMEEGDEAASDDSACE